MESFAAITADEDTTTRSNDADNSDNYYLANGYHGRPASSYLRGGINRRRNDQLIDDADFHYNISYDDDVMMDITASSSSSSNNTNTNNLYFNPTNTTNYHIVIMIVLIGLIVVLAMNMLYLMYKPTYLKYVQRKLFPKYYNKSQSKLIERRYYAIDRWLIQKTIQPHDDICECIQNYCRQRNGESSLGIITEDTTTIDTPTSMDDDSSPSSSFPPICLTTSFETVSTSADSNCRCDNSSDSGTETGTDIEFAVVVVPDVVQNGSGIEILHNNDKQQLNAITDTDTDTDTDDDDDVLKQIEIVEKNTLRYATTDSDSDSDSSTTDSRIIGTSIGIEVAYNNTPRTASQSHSTSASALEITTASIMKGGGKLEGGCSGTQIILKQEQRMNGIIQQQPALQQPLVTRVQILTKMEIMKRKKKHHHQLVLQQQQRQQQQHSAKRNNDDEPDDDTPTTKNINGVLVLTSDEDEDKDDVDVDDDCLYYPDGCDGDDESEGIDLHSKPSCSICMESFKLGDKISISPTINCPHVFHHNCIREWLLRKKACPCCRIIMLPIDRPSTTSTVVISTSTPASTPTLTTITSTTETTEIETVLQERQQRYRNNNKVEKKKKKKTIVESKYIYERTNRKCGTYFCIDCGLIQLKKELREDLLLPGRKNDSRKNSRINNNKYINT